MCTIYSLIAAQQLRGGFIARMAKRFVVCVQAHDL
jgi:hypothetical protein